MVLALHVFACILWRLKTEVDPEGLTTFLNEKGLSGESSLENYIICMYFVCTIFTTVGFGDIYAYNSAERVFCVLTMLVAVCLFGALLGELQEIVAALSRSSKEVEDRVEDVAHFLIVNRVPRAVTNEVKAWIRFKYSNDQQNERMNFLFKDLPSALCGRVAKTLNEKLFSKIRLFQKIHDPIDRARFAAMLLPRLQFACYPAMSVLADHRVPADRLITILSGRVSLSAPAPKNEPPGRRSILGILFSGDGIGDLSVLGDQRWAGGYGIDADFIALENTHVAFVETREIKEVLRSFPSLRRVRRYFQAIAYRPPLKDKELQPQEQPNLENLEKQAKTLKAIYDWIDLARRLLAVDAKSRRATPFSFPIPLDGAISSAYSRPSASEEASRDPATAPAFGGSGGYGWSIFSSGFSSTFVSRSGSADWVIGSPSRTGRPRIVGDGGGGGVGANGLAKLATSEAAVSVVNTGGSASMAAASRPSALGAGAAGVGAWQTAVQFLAPIQSAPTPPITSAPSDLSGGGDGGRGADQTKSWSQSIERAPSDAGSGGGFSASSAGGDSAAGSSAARQMWMKAASS
eukprot:CAMPEP_0172213196 /NCGR_PEP_ID=MMETSP1050-20130122/37453_1 /TAXON_ID=233186 /ORGANISM="Cryptomonas curvata, Strain CCAP979/52" /LENGTH=575 /DNA_ID=CAMNT_0012893991 /DNA_START=16 /DNA_END=1739 /DNA_ORIENTATION=+